MKKAIIGGTGVYGMGEAGRVETVTTPYGSVEVDLVTLGKEEVVFLARHGKKHSVPPHLINYRANMKALEQLGVKWIYATAAVGSCNESFAPGDLVVINDFLDFTKNRPVTYFEGGDAPVGHVDMTTPYCPMLREKFMAAAAAASITIKGEGVYVCTEGPRFESHQEIRMFRMLGGDVVGMTNIPEAIFAKELGMCYATVGMISNWCTGMQQDQIALHDIEAALGNNKEKLTQAFLKVFEATLDQHHCTCNRSVVTL